MRGIHATMSPQPPKEVVHPYPSGTFTRRGNLIGAF